jgi:hypothetical protein
MTQTEKDKKLEIMRLRLIELCNSKKVGDGSKQIKEIHELSRKRTLLIEDRSK